MQKSSTFLMDVSISNSYQGYYLYEVKIIILPFWELSKVSYSFLWKVKSWRLENVWVLSSHFVWFYLDYHILASSDIPLAVSVFIIIIEHCSVSFWYLFFYHDFIHTLLAVATTASECSSGLLMVHFVYFWWEQEHATRWCIICSLIFLLLSVCEGSQDHLSK